MIMVLVQVGDNYDDRCGKFCHKPMAQGYGVRFMANQDDREDRKKEKVAEKPI